MVERTLKAKSYDGGYNLACELSSVMLLMDKPTCPIQADHTDDDRFETYGYDMK